MKVTTLSRILPTPNRMINNKKCGWHTISLSYNCTLIYAEFSNSLAHGEYIRLCDNNVVEWSMRWRNQRHGEFMKFCAQGCSVHKFYDHNIDITDKVKLIVKDINNITDYERHLIFNKWQCF